MKVGIHPIPGTELRCEIYNVAPRFTPGQYRFSLLTVHNHVIENNPRTFDSVQEAYKEALYEARFAKLNSDL